MNEARLELKIRALEEQLDRLKSERKQVIDIYNETLEELNQVHREYSELQDKYHDVLEEQHEQTWLNPPVYEECFECKSKEEQYQRIRSAFERRKQQHQAIAEFFKHYHFTHNGQKVSLTKLIKFGRELL